MGEPRWDPRIGRYRDSETGRFIGRTLVNIWIETSLRSSAQIGATLANYVFEQTVSVRDFGIMMRQEIKDEYIRQFLTGIGGRDRMNSSLWGKVGSMIQEQYKYLNNFLADISSGNLTEGQIRMRAQMYLNSAREAFETAKKRTAEELGYDEVLWLITPGIGNCAGCEEFYRMGWVKIVDDPYKGAYPGSGQTQCLTACKCQTHYRNSETGKEYFGL